MPEDLFAVQILYSASGCKVLATWHSLADVEESTVTHYSVFANETLMSNETVSSVVRNKTMVSSLFNVPSCATHKISVSADSCGESIRTGDFVLSSEILRNLDTSDSTVHFVTTNQVDGTNPTIMRSCKSSLI